MSSTGRTPLQSSRRGRILVRDWPDSMLMPIPLFIGLILGGGLSVVAAILGVIALFKGLARAASGIAPVVFAAIFIALTLGRHLGRRRHDLVGRSSDSRINRLEPVTWYLPLLRAVPALVLAVRHHVHAGSLLAARPARARRIRARCWCGRRVGRRAEPGRRARRLVAQGAHPRGRRHRRARLPRRWAAVPDLPAVVGGCDHRVPRAVPRPARRAASASTGCSSAALTALLAIGVLIVPPGFEQATAGVGWPDRGAHRIHDRGGAARRVPCGDRRVPRDRRACR